MTTALAALALLVLGQAEGASGLAAGEAGPAPAKATLDSQASADLLAANVVNDAVGAGTPAELTALELGVAARLHATALSGSAHVDVDYQGRQPVGGTSPNSAIHLLTQAELSVDLLDAKLTVGLGRFLAPSAGLLPVDGLRARARLSRVELQLFGGRRAITSSRTGNVDLGTFLPAAGASAALTLSSVQAELAVTFDRDEVPLRLGAAPQTHDALAASARAVGRPVDGLVLGAEAATAQRASYLVGPTWNSVALSARTIDLAWAAGFVEWRPLKPLRLGYDVHFQQASVFREGLRLDPNDAQVTAEGFAPRFLDQRVRARWRQLGLGWVSPEARLRVRPDWQEWRLGGTADLSPEWASGFCLRGGFTFEKLVQTGTAPAPADRSFWSASLGWRGRGLDVAVGASDVQRSALPLSSRVYTPYDDTPTAAVDLSPFVLGAQRLASLRVFYGSDLWFAGLDFEQSLTDGRERRVFAQLGARLEKAW